MGDTIPAAILTREEVAHLRAAFRLKSTGGAKAVSDLCDTADELRARLESAERERDEAAESRFALIVENEQQAADLAASSERATRLTDALQRAEQDAREHVDTTIFCGVCRASVKRPFGQVAADIPHRPTCPFWVLTAAARAALEKANGH